MFNNIENTIKELNGQGYKISDPWDIVEVFEQKVAEYSGSKYAIATDSCTNSIFLCLKYFNASGEIEIPKKTYLSVPQLIIHAGCIPKFVDLEWEGTYQLRPYPVIDSATRFTKGMYQKGTYQCLSFHIRKNLPITKGGMILTDNKYAYDWFKEAEYEGRDRRVPHDEMLEPTICGWNMYMPPEQAARGIEIFNTLPDSIADCGGSYKYADISNYKIWNLK